MNYYQKYCKYKNKYIIYKKMNININNNNNNIITYNNKISLVGGMENINKYTKTNQINTFLDLSYEELAIINTPLILKERISENLIWVAPKSSDLILDKSKPTVLYHSFWLNKDWRSEISANRILVLEPSWFKKFPVSQKVTDSIIEIAGEIPGIQVYVGNIDESGL
jgi:deoxyribodipyrimidine photo-lyase